MKKINYKKFALLNGFGFIEEGEVFDSIKELKDNVSISKSDRIVEITWTEEIKEEKEGWINIYSDYSRRGKIYFTENEAIKSKDTDCVATIKIKWEE